MQGFEYPTTPHVRRHGPEGYTNYESYRDWLRDEFTFRCVYCLVREQWYNRAATFNIDHFIPVTVDPSGACEYTNLLYACATCNNAKRSILNIPDPCLVAFHDCLRIKDTGELEALNSDGEKLRDALLLNSKSNIDFRSRLMRTLDNLKQTNLQLYTEWMSFPDDLPDLRRPRKQVPRNIMPDGARNCYFALRERGELPAMY